MYSELKYPIVMYLKKQSFPFVYTFAEKERMHKSSIDIINSEQAKDIKLIDAEGSVCSVKKIHVVRYLGLWGFTLRYRGRSVLIDYEYETEVGFISLENFKEDIIKRVHKTASIWNESYGSIHELIRLINYAKSYEEVMMLLH